VVVLGFACWANLLRFDPFGLTPADVDIDEDDLRSAEEILSQAKLVEARVRAIRGEPNM